MILARSRRRARRPVLPVIPVVAALLALGGCASSATPGRVAPASRPPVTQPAVATPDPGSLPQTMVVPTADAAFQARMAALWSAISSGDPNRGLSAFLPEGAYAQIKAIPDPAADFATRLLAGFDRDIAAAHRLAGVSSSTLLAVDLPALTPGWVPPHGCSNRVGYYHLAGARLVYATGGRTASIGIALLDSWRGQWYVVHLGDEGRSGVVDAPRSGPGVAGGPQGTC